MNILTVGNSAKLYCLNWIENLLQGGVMGKGNEFKILDLGCGAALNFVNLLKLYPQGTIEFFSEIAKS